LPLDCQSGKSPCNRYTSRVRIISAVQVYGADPAANNLSHWILETGIREPASPPPPTCTCTTLSLIYSLDLPLTELEFNFDGPGKQFLIDISITRSDINLTQLPKFVIVPRAAGVCRSSEPRFWIEFAADVSIVSHMNRVNCRRCNCFGKWSVHN
jgi:hypothetical protein